MIDSKEVDLMPSTAWISWSSASSFQPNPFPTIFGGGSARGKIELIPLLDLR
jgi:hypothetical protein